MNHDHTEERITSFIKLWKEVYGEELSRGEARMRITQLLNIYRIFSKPIADVSHASSTKQDSP